MKKLLLISCALVALTGCTTIVATDGKQPSVTVAPIVADHMIINSTGYAIDVYQDGQRVAQNVPFGNVLSLRPFWFRRTSAVAVTGRTSSGEYAGSAQWTFRYDCPETWELTRLNQPDF